MNALRGNTHIMQANNNSVKDSYQTITANIIEMLERTSEIMDSLECSKQSRQAREAAERIKYRIFSVGIIGEFKRGISTVVNVLLGEEIAPVDILPTTSVVCRYKYGPSPKATIVYKDGCRKEIPVNQLDKYMTRTTNDREAAAKLVEQAVVEYPCQLCQNNVELIDTPGLNADQRTNEITESIIPKLDAAVLVCSVGSPIASSEINLIHKLLWADNLKSLYILVNKMDTIRSGQTIYDRFIESCKVRTLSVLQDHLEAIHGKNSKWGRTLKSRLADVRFYPISAIQAMDGLMENDPKLVEESRFPAFEEDLRKMLIQGRAAQTVTEATELIHTLLNEAQSLLFLRINMLTNPPEAGIDELHKTFADKIEKFRKGRDDRLHLIHCNSQDFYNLIECTAKEIYAGLELRLLNRAEKFWASWERLRAQNKVSGSLHEFLHEFKRNWSWDDGTHWVLVEAAEKFYGILREYIEKEWSLVKTYLTHLKHDLSKVYYSVCGDGLTDSVPDEAVWVDRTNFSLGQGEEFPLEKFPLIIEKRIDQFLCRYYSEFETHERLKSPQVIISTVKKDAESLKRGHSIDILTNAVKKSVESLSRERTIENWIQRRVEIQINRLVGILDEKTEEAISSMDLNLKLIGEDISRTDEDSEQQIKKYRLLEEKLLSVRDRLMD